MCTLSLKNADAQGTKIPHRVSLCGTLISSAWTWKVGKGGERFVLETIDMHKTNIWVIMIEQDGWNKEKD
jgi:hypothetical protein